MNNFQCGMMEKVAGLGTSLQLAGLYPHVLSAKLFPKAFKSTPLAYLANAGTLGAVGGLLGGASGALAGAVNGNDVLSSMARGAGTGALWGAGTGLAGIAIPHLASKSSNPELAFDIAGSTIPLATAMGTLGAAIQPWGHQSI